jgi:hypothetical protein
MPNRGKFSRAAGRESRKAGQETTEKDANFGPFSKALTLFTER